MDEIAIKNAIAATRLAIEIVPDTCVIARVREHLKPEDWNAVAAKCALDAENKCQICAKAMSASRLECSEAWDFDDEQMQLRLVGIKALCRQCFHTRSITRRSAPEELQIAVYHLVNLNSWSEELARFYINVAFRVWERRSEYDWKQDLSHLKTKYRVNIIEPDTGKTKK